MNGGSFRVDMHVKVLDERVVARAKRRGLDGLVYAPHFTRFQDAKVRAYALSDDELEIFPAREIFTGTWRNRRHVLALGLTDPVPDFITLEGALAELQRQGAAILVPHPTFLSVSLSASDVRRFRDSIHGLEVYNPKHLSVHNRRARDLARETEVPPFASSYAHLRATVGEVWTKFDRHYGEEEFVTALKDGVDRRIFHRDGPAHRLRRAAEGGHLAWENTWEKVDRVLLSGTEPTHPDHIAYGGRFDDIAVY